jgi:hypothetical protein
MELPYTAEWFTAAAIINKYLIVGWLDPSEDQHPCPFDKAFNVHTLPCHTGHVTATHLISPTEII